MLTPHIEARQEARTQQRYQVRFAQGESEVRAAQKLRYEVFAEEFGAQLDAGGSGIDADYYDPYCEHLIVRDETAGRIVGTYRVLAPAAAKRVGSYYSENEFYLTRLAQLRPQLVEIGRSCIAADHRHGTVIALLWMKLAEYMTRNDYRYLIGCASVPMHDGGHNAANLFTQLSASHMAPDDYRAMPRAPLPYDRLANGQQAEVPPLIKGYLRAGAWVCGEPAWDPYFNSADLLLLLPMARLAARYQKHFMRG